MSDDGSTVTPDDVAGSNEALIQRTAYFAQLVGTGLVAVAAVGALAWLYVAARQQLNASDFTFGGNDGTDPVSLGERLNLFASAFGYLMQAALVLAIGVAIRLLAQWATARTGGSLTGFQPGDPFPGEAEA